MDANQINQMRLGLIKAGAVLMPYFRQPRDANGVTSGEAEHIGCILGLKYSPNGQNQMRVDIPGIIMRANSDHIEGMLHSPSDATTAPSEGDRILVSGVRRAIVSVMRASGCVYTLVLADE